MEKGSFYRPVEEIVGEVVISPQIRAGVKVMLQEFSSIRKGRSFSYEFTTELGFSEKLFIRRRFFGADRMSLVEFDSVDAGGVYKTTVRVIKGGRQEELLQRR
ncbi:hypothetical protein HY408_02145 [Candidatus Gottesmanbacteria bacterium]|nr:hypothetical protein [Candidatus Gottesmanbacteria bacterium]